MSESNLLIPNNWAEIDRIKWQAQTFRPQETHDVQWADVQISSYRKTPTMYAYINKSIGAPLWLGPHVTVSYRTLPAPGSIGEPIRTRFYMTKRQLLASQEYILRIISSHTVDGYPRYWGFMQGTNPYPRGIRLSSNDMGGSWTQHPGDDMVFSEFGTPPAPTYADEVPINHWLPTSARSGRFSNGLCITLTTNVPCHLWCYVTDKPPTTKQRTRTFRGLQVPWCPSVAFSYKQIIEQQQLGDTIWHTFPIKTLTSLGNYWLVFRGTIDNKSSPSLSSPFLYPYDAQSEITNPSFDRWDNPLSPPNYWQFSRTPGKSTDLSPYPPAPGTTGFSARYDQIGYANMAFLYQYFEPSYYRAQRISIRAWGNGLPEANNDIYVLIDGSGGGSFSQPLTKNHEWEHVKLTFTVPHDATNMLLAFRAYTGTHWSNITYWDWSNIELP